MTGPIIAILLAAVLVAIWTVVLIASVQDWRHFHDERAARSVLLGFVLLASGAGGIVSAFGYYLNVTTGGTSDVLAVLANLARGAMIVGGLAYVATLYQRRKG